MKHRSRLPLLIACALLSSAAGAADPIAMDIAPALEGFSPERGTVPVAVELRNDGPDARGILRVSANNYQMDYPVDLPRGSEKRLITYPTLDYSGARYSLLTNQGRMIRAYEPPGGFSAATTSVLLLSDNSGDLAFLRSNDQAQNRDQGVQDSYCRPGLAPTRPLGYASVAAVALGTGSERLTDAEVAALRSWTLTGGTLLFLGGASAPVLSDPRWRDLLPVGRVEPRTLNDSGVLEQLGGAPAPAVTVLSGKPVAGASARSEGGVLLTAERPFGLGKAIYLAFNPLEPPLTGWSGRKSALTRIFRPTDSTRARAFLQSYSREGEVTPFSAASYGPGSVTPTAYPGPKTIPAVPPGTPDSSDPFSTTLPPAERVLKILGLYFLLVVPFNFLVLRKLKRSELAWVTAPVLSLGFAGVLFTSAQGLYSARMSTATVGIVIAQQGVQEGMFVGTSQIFLPRAGIYDLKLNDVESLGVIQTDPNSYFENEDTAQFDPVDVGEIQVPAMHANNLAFRRLTFRQRLPVGEWFSVDVTPKDAGKWSCTVRNTGSHTLTNARINVGPVEHVVGELKPGQTKTLTLSRPAASSVPAEFQSWGVQQFLARQNGVALTGALDDVRPGPQIGEVVRDRSRVNLVLFAKESLGKP